MELASAGIDVDLYDKNDRCLTQASAQNNGKIHLGYTYACDRTLRTARTMVKGGTTFGPLLRRWLGGEIDRIPVSSPSHYAVHDESLLGVDAVENHFRATHEIAVEESCSVPLDYFGSDYRLQPRRLSSTECDLLFDRKSVTAAFITPEVSVDPEILADLVRERLGADSKIRCLLGAHVDSVKDDAEKPAVNFEMSGTSARERYDHVVNCLWDGRLAVDKTAGLAPERPWLYRLEYYLRLHAPALASAIPCVTIVLGPFGTIAAYGNGDSYLSWYPASMRAMSSDLSPPAWSLELDEAAAQEMRRSILASLARIVPAVSRLTPKTIELCQVKGGIAFAWGKSDIDDPASGLHERHAIGPVSRGRYHTIDTGKLTMAPLFGKLVADRIRQIG